LPREIGRLASVALRSYSPRLLSLHHKTFSEIQSLLGLDQIVSKPADLGLERVQRLDWSLKVQGTWSLLQALRP
jgi:hypothetical protein